MSISREPGFDCLLAAALLVAGCGGASGASTDAARADGGGVDGSVAERPERSDVVADTGVDSGGDTTAESSTDGGSDRLNGEAHPTISPDGTQITSGSNEAVYNGYGAWSFGPVVTPPTRAGPPGPYGDFRYVKLNGKVVDMVNNTIWSAQAIRIDHGGNVFFLCAQNDRWWFQFVGYTSFTFFVGSPDIDPTAVHTSPAPPTTFNPPYTPSADGTTISGGTGSLTTEDGVWTFGAGSVDWPPVLNGVPLDTRALPASSNVLAMKVSAQGNLFAQASVDHTWYVYLNFSWYAVGASVPVGPIPIEVNLTPTLAYIKTTAPIGTLVSAIKVEMSDGSAFAGKLSINAGDLVVSGSNLVVDKPLVAGNVFYTVTATQAGVSSSSGASTIEVVASN